MRTFEPFIMRGLQALQLRFQQNISHKECLRTITAVRCSA